jgi:hypothetical protein
MANPFYDRVRTMVLSLRDELRALPTGSKIAAEDWVYRFSEGLVR